MTLPEVPADLWREALTLAASLGVLGLLVYALVAAAKHSLHALGADLGAAGWQVALRWTPILLGAALGLLPSVLGLPGAWPGLAGAVAGAFSRGVHRLVAKRWPDLALTKAAREWPE